MLGTSSELVLNRFGFVSKLGFITARDLGTGIINHLDFHRGGGFEAIFFDTARLTREGGGNPGDGLYRASLDFIIHWRTSHAG